jgi:hypothetical protein
MSRRLGRSMFRSGTLRAETEFSRCRVVQVSMAGQQPRPAPVHTSAGGVRTASLQEKNGELGACDGSVPAMHSTSQSRGSEPSPGIMPPSSHCATPGTNCVSGGAAGNSQLTSCRERREVGDGAAEATTTRKARMGAQDASAGIAGTVYILCKPRAGSGRCAVVVPGRVVEDVVALGTRGASSVTHG